ncbi:MAG: alginate export family protein [Elusimicrobia bacterium]|nr:alginate export family protein [Elusimicrobiota bacterium]
MKDAVLAVLACSWLLAAGAAAQSPAPAGWKLAFGAEERVRFETRENFDFNDAVDDSAGVTYQRLKLNARAELPGKLELFAEALDLGAVYENMARPAQYDRLDLHQAYAAAKVKPFGRPLELKVGRQELKYGQGRLLWAAVWANRINHFDAAVVKYKSGGLSADLIYGARVSYDETGWNDPNRHDILAGTYVTYRRSKEAPLLEGYFLDNYDSSNLSTLNRRTAGLRAQATLPGAVVCDLELPYQFGKSSGKSVYASAFHLDLSREFKAAWSPRAAAAYNYASGDKKPADSVNNTFIPLFQSSHEPYGAMDFFRWQNMRELALELSAKPVKGLKLTAGTSYLWLAAVRDSWYDSAGKKLRTNAAGTADPYVGREVSLLAKWEIGGGAALDGGYAHFFTGQYVKDTGKHDDADWAYLQFNMKI